MPATVLRLLLVLVVLTGLQSYLVIETAFALNRDEIAARFCVNRDRPEAHCNGACELARRLEAQNEREEEREAALLGLALSSTMWLPPAVRLAPPEGAVPARARPEDEGAVSGPRGDVFHPPRAA
jgi:hypothetical protein